MTKIGKWIPAIIESILLVGILIACVIMISKITANQDQEQEPEVVATPRKANKVVLYEGPKSLKDATKEDIQVTPETMRDITLKHCVDTKIEVDGRESYVYDTNVNNSRQWSSSYTPSMGRTPITYFDFEGEVEIKVTVPDIDIKTVKVSPMAYEINPVVDIQNHTVTFQVKTPDAYTITFNDSATRAVHIFANSIETNLPDFNDENVIYIGPGEWKIENIVLQSGQTLYLSGGAVVHGIVNANFADEITICGRGIIDGSHLQGWGGTNAYIPLKFDYCNQVMASGILLLNPNAWVVQGYATKNMTIDNLKIISCRPNGDGISLQSCQDVTVSNGFVRSWDDSLVVKNYAGNSTNINFEHMQLWTDLAQSMEVGYETNKGRLENAQITDVKFEDITVLNNFHKPVISVHNADDALVSNITFRNITVENAQMGSGDGKEMPYLIDLHIAQSTNWSSTRDRGIIRDITIDNVKVLSGNFCSSRIQGFDDQHRIENVTISKLNILGQEIKDFESGKIAVDEKTTSNIKIE